MALAHLTENGFYVRSVEASEIDGGGTFTPLPDYDPEAEIPIFAGTEWVVVPLSVRDDYVPPPPPPPPVPEEVTRRQAKTALSRAQLLSAADAAIAAMPGQAGEEARIDWADAGVFRRDNPLIAAMGEALGLGPDAVDDLFRSAAAL